MGFNSAFKGLSHQNAMQPIYCQAHDATDSCNMASSLQLSATFRTCIWHTSVFHI